MINFKYFKTYFKESLFFLLFISLTLIFLFVIPIFTIYINEDYIMSWPKDMMPNFFTLSILIIIITFVSSIYLVSYKTKIRKLDIYYSLPISKRSFFNTRALVIFVDLIIAVTLAFILGTIVFSFKLIGINNPYNFIQLIPFYFSIIGSIIPLYIFSITCSFFGSSLVDSSIFLASYTFIPTLIFKQIYFYLSNNYSHSMYAGESLTPYFTLRYVSNKFEDKFCGIKQPAVATNFDIYPIIVFVILSIILFVLFEIFIIEKDTAENLNGSRKVLYGFKVIIPLDILGTVALFSSILGSYIIKFGGFIICFISTVVVFFSLYFISKKSFKIQKDIIPLAIISFSLAYLFLIIYPINSSLYPNKKDQILP